MKKILLLGVCAAALCSVPVLASDLPVRPTYKPVVAPPPPSIWNGCYLGANVGGAWASASVNSNLTGETLSSPNEGGWAGGAQFGCDAQSGNWVFGFETMWDAASVNHQVSGLYGAPATYKGTLDWFGTLTGRLGYAMGPSLLYVKAGGAWAGMHASLQVPVVPFSGTTSGNGGGWVVGGGWEYAFAPNLSAKIEYDYMGLGNRNINTNLVAAGTLLNISGQSVQTVLVGLNYRFGH